MWRVGVEKGSKIRVAFAEMKIIQIPQLLSIFRGLQGLSAM